MQFIPVLMKLYDLCYLHDGMAAKVEATVRVLGYHGPLNFFQDGV